MDTAEKTLPKSPRRRGPSGARAGEVLPDWILRHPDWVPAFAGMTGRGCARCQSRSMAMEHGATSDTPAATCIALKMPLGTMHAEQHPFKCLRAAPRTCPS